VPYSARCCFRSGIVTKKEGPIDPFGWLLHTDVTFQLPNLASSRISRKFVNVVHQYTVWEHTKWKRGALRIQFGTSTVPRSKKITDGFTKVAQECYSGTEKTLASRLGGTIGLVPEAAGSMETAFLISTAFFFFLGQRQPFNPPFGHPPG